jgi:hypothetical protein
MKQEQIEQVADLIDEAGYFIGYWAVKGTHDTEAQTYAIKLDEDAAEEFGESKVVITYAQIDEAIRKLAKGGIIRSDLTEQAQAYVSEPGDADLDAEFADCAVQVAIFGEVVFG